MTLKWIGALLILISCGGLGGKMVAAHRYEERTLRQLISLLDYMNCELQYRLTPLPTLCRQTASEVNGVLSDLFLNLTKELEDQLSPDVYRCMLAAICKTKHLPAITKKALEELGQSLGRFDLEGQIKGLEAAPQSCRTKLEELCANRDHRLRGYQTLALCDGAALVILFI